MHFSTPLVLSSLFSLSLTAPVIEQLKEQRPGRLLVWDNKPTYQTYGMKSGVSLATEPNKKDTAPFTITALASESPFHELNIVASNGKFFIGNETRSLCPPEVKGCPLSPLGNVTALTVSKEGNAYLDVVNKPQAIFIDPKAQLRFTPPKVPVGKGAQQATFTVTPNPIPAPPDSAALVNSGVGRATGYQACPLTRPPFSRLGPWQVFVNLPSLDDKWAPSGDFSDCFGFDIQANDYESPVPAAYEYV
ncbi:MAG: hypothetical protein Q9221_007272 [Calogaya cf. arnoldii]